MTSPPIACTLDAAEDAEQALGYLLGLAPVITPHPRG
jgi:hypothetical protein